MKAIHAIAFILVIIGGLNWLVVGLFGVNVVSYLGEVIETIVYILVGLSALYLAFTHKSSCKNCTASTPAPTQTM